MIVKVEEYMCSRIPEREDIEAAYEIAKKNGIIVKLVWGINPIINGKYSMNADKYERLITPVTDIDSIVNSIPKIYPI